MAFFVRVGFQAFGPSCKLQAASCKLQAASCKLQAASCKLQAASCKLQAASCKLQAKYKPCSQHPQPALMLAACRLPLAANNLFGPFMH
ncbi:hypothetical protein TU84_13255 [Pseudomonas helleri]|nr:hypothetical protein TU84_13255 [Pseudomonas helleri]